MIFFYLSSNLGNFANMTQEYQIRVLPQVAYTEENIKQYIACLLYTSDAADEL